MRPSEGRKKGWRNLLLVAAKVAISAGVLWYLLSGQDIALVGSKLAGSDKLLWVGAFLLVLASQALSSWRWQILLRPLGFELPFRRVFNIYFTGTFFSLFLPSLVGGDAVKAWYVARGWRKVPAAVYTLLADRGIGLAALMAFALLGALLSWSSVPPALGWSVALFTGVLYTAYFLFPYVSGPVLLLFRKLREMPRERLFAYWADPRPAARAFAISLPIHLLLVLAHVLMAKSLGIAVPWWGLVLVYPLAGLAGMVPLSLNGMGWRDAAYIWTLGQFAVPSEAALSLAGMWFVIILANGLLGVVPFLLLRSREPLVADDGG